MQHFFQVAVGSRYASLSSAQKDVCSFVCFPWTGSGCHGSLSDINRRLIGFEANETTVFITTAEKGKEKTMTSLVGWMLKRWSWKSFAVGAGAIIVGGTVARPALVSAVKTGMEVADAGVASYNEAKNQMIAIRNDAAKLRTTETAAEAGGVQELLVSIQAELQNLRQDVAANKAAAVKKPA